MPLDSNLKPEVECTIIRGDALDKLDSIDDASVDLVVTSPPYNIGKEYEKDQRRSLDAHIDWLEPIIQKLVDKLSDKANLCWQSGNYICPRTGAVYPLDIYFFPLFLKYGLVPRNRIIWRFNFGLNANKRFSGRYETILWFSKGGESTFNLDPVRVPQMYPGKRHNGSKGERAGKPSGNPLGKNPSDFWEFDPSLAFERDPVWELPNVKSNHPEKTDHPCQFPIELVERCVLALSNKGDTVLDPFLGAGTTAIAAAIHERRVIGIDRDESYIELAQRRLQALKDGTLKRRPGGKPIARPVPGQKVSSIPAEWIENI